MKNQDDTKILATKLSLNGQRYMALANYLDLKSIRDARDLIDSNDYLVLTDRESDKYVKVSILDTIWAFKSSFLSRHLKKGIDSSIIDTIQSNDRCESNNAAILSLIKDVDDLVDDAVSCDGRGHFLSSYNGEEIEMIVDGIAFYVYRQN